MNSLEATLLHPVDISANKCLGTSQRTHIRCRSFDRVPLDTVSVSRACLSLVNWPHTSIQPFGKRIHVNLSSLLVTEYSNTHGQSVNNVQPSWNDVGLKLTTK